MHRNDLLFNATLQPSSWRAWFCERGGSCAFVLCFTLSACSNTPDSLRSCASAPLSAEVNVVETTATELWRWPPGGAQPTVALVDDNAIYWYEDGGAIWRLVKGSSVAEQVRRAPEQPVWIRGFVADAERLYWGESDLIASPLEPASPTLPGRLWSADKATLEARLLLEYSDAILFPLSVAGDGVYAQQGGFGGGPFLRIPLAGGQPSKLPSIPADAQLFGDRYYWVEPGMDEQPGELWRGRLSDPTPHSLGPIEGSELDVGPEHVLWHHDRYESGPPAVLYQSFVLIDERRGCTANMPGAGESISFATAVDAEHVYWHSYNKAGAVIAYADGRPSPPLPDLPLYRMHLESGRIEQIEAPGFSSPDYSFIVGDDTEQLYVTTPEALVSIRKPAAHKE